MRIFLFNNVPNVIKLSILVIYDFMVASFVRITRFYVTFQSLLATRP